MVGRMLVITWRYGVYHLLPTCPVCMEVRIKVLCIRIFFTVWTWDFQLHFNNKDYNKWYSLPNITSLAKQITSFYKPTNTFGLRLSHQRGYSIKCIEVTKQL